MLKALKIHERDNVAVVLGNVEKGEDVILSNESLNCIQAKDMIPVYHKISLTEIPEDGPVYKYGEIIGLASRLIQKGEHVHEHNVKSVLKTNN